MITTADGQPEEKTEFRRSAVSKELALQLLARGQAFETALLLRAIAPLVKNCPQLKISLDELTSKALDPSAYELAYKDFRTKLQTQPHLHEMFHVELRQDRYELFKHAQEIVPGVFLSSEFPLLDGEKLLKAGITHVVQCNQVGHRIPGIVYLNLNMRDCETQNARATFGPAFNFISTAVDQNNNVLVHCEMGVSRSATVVIAYCMLALKLDFEDAYALVRRQRPIIDPNSGFISQLMNFESHIKYDKLIPRVSLPVLPCPPEEPAVISSPTSFQPPSSITTATIISSSPVPKKRPLRSYLPKLLGGT